jgi:FkbM family methyltransferase
MAQITMPSLIRKLLSTESEWNPKVIAGRVITRVLPEKIIHQVKKHYYAYLLTHMPKDWVERDAAALPQFISPGDHVVDIGANLGVFSRFMAGLVGLQGRVYAFEPIPQTAEFLRHNVSKMKLTQVEPMPYALSDKNRTDTMVIPTYRWGSECWYDATIKTEKARAGWREIQVESRTLDSFHFPKISFLKCDTNGHELATLRGAMETIRRDHPVMLIEVNPDPDDPTSAGHETFALLAREGYTAHVFLDGKMRPRRSGERSQNYFFFPQNKAF